jgi:2-polyprenyl-3-methyl-5-hydroxy-6-metoxy-1,4-benzoquinol methylase
MMYYEKYWNSLKNRELKDFVYKWPVLSSYISILTKGTILDFGCGDGKILDEIAKLNPGANLIGTDVSDIAIKEAKKAVPNARYIKICDGGIIPLKDNSIDFIVALDVIEHVFDTENMFNELARIIKSGGQILISTPFCGFIKNVLIAMIGFETVYDPTGPHIRYYTKKSLTRCLTDCGFYPVKWGVFGRFYPISKGMYVLARKTENKRMHIRYYNQ